MLRTRVGLRGGTTGGCYFAFAVQSNNLAKGDLRT